MHKLGLVLMTDVKPNLDNLKDRLKEAKDKQKTLQEDLDTIQQSLNMTAGKQGGIYSQTSPLFHQTMYVTSI